MTTDEFNYLRCIPRAVFDSSGLSGSYQAANGTGFADDIKILKMYNASDQGIDISYDGSTDHDFIPSKGALILDLQTNHSTESAYGMGVWRGQKGQIVYVKGSAGSGNLYIIGYR